MDDVRARFEDISADLNLDSAVSAVAWSNFDKTRKVFCLEGNPLHWIACSLTHACWQANVDTVQGQGANPVHAGGVSLNNILRKCEIDFRQYFTQINKWNDMNSVPEAFRVRNDQLRKNYTNTMHMYRKYWDKFLLLFNYYGQEELVVNVGSGGTVTGARRNGRLQAQQHKKEKIKCTARSLYEFCWCLYASIKAEMNDNVKDLIMTHSLLLCCLDLMFANCWAERRFDLINPKFPGLPADWRTLSQSPSNVPPCILKHLSDDNPLVEVLEMKKYMFQRALTKLVKEQTLSNGKVAAGADPEPPYHSLLSEQNFDGNFRGINKHYDEYVLNNGQIDEKLFLVADNFGMPQNPHQGIGHDGAAGAGQVPPPTPLTRATDCLRRLNNILGEHHSASPPDRIIQLFKNCTNQPLVFIQSVIERNKKLYLTRVRQDVGNRFHTVVQVAYFLLGNFYEAERQRKKESVENLLTDENFLNSLLACSVEIVNSAYHNPMQFPWILECFELKAFVFYKIIEPVVQNHRDLLTCHVIKHLQRIEEQCMESYVWVDGSPVWDLLGEDALAPTCEASRAHVGAMGNGVQRNLFATGGGGDAAGASGELVVPPELASLHATIGVGGAGNGGSQPATPKKHSMTMFFRKFYIQAFNRLQTLFKDLEMGDAAQLTEVWTIFEYVIVHHLELMRNRHLDQLIMCAVYVYGRTKPDVRNAQFKTIMQKYRNQPHSSSHVYRGVYLGPSTEAALQAVKEQDKANSKPPRPIDDVDEQAGHAVSHPNEIRGDIIQFYNQVYMPKVQQFAVKFSREADRPPMSPVPQQVRLQNTPRKLCNALYVSTQEARCDFRSPVEIRLPHSSPMERHDFTQINEMIRVQPSAAKKRVLSYEGGDGETQIGGTQKLKKMMKDRTNMATK